MKVDLTEGLLKAVMSTFYMDTGHRTPNYVIKFDEEVVYKEGKIKLFANQGTAKSFMLFHLENMFKQGEYWHKYRDNLKARNNGREFDWSASIAIMPQYGLTSRFTTKEFKKYIKDLRNELLEKKIFEIVLLNL